MKDDIQTQQHAVVIARDYGLFPFTPLKCERVIPEGIIQSLFFANTSNIVKGYAQFNRDHIMAKGVEGDPCTACWSEDKLWEDEMVPMYVFCTLSGFQPPVEFLNTVFEPSEPIKMGVYMLKQKNAPDCTYEYLDDDVEIIWTPDDVTSTLVVTTKPDNIIRMDASAGGCFKQFKQDGTRAEINYYQP
ncbi:hypothetical protein ES707_13409 [subsurface metagenome]